MRLIQKAYTALESSKTGPILREFGHGLSQSFCFTAATRHHICYEVLQGQDIFFDRQQIFTGAEGAMPWDEGGDLGGGESIKRGDPLFRGAAA